MRFYLLFGIILLLFVLPSQAQRIESQVQLSKDSVLIGDRIQLQVRIKYPKDVVLKGLDLSGYKQIPNTKYPADTIHLDKYADISILDAGKWKNIAEDFQVTAAQLDPVLSGNDFIIDNIITIAIYNEGTYRIPEPAFLQDSGESTVPASGKVVHVYLPAPMQSDSIALNPIKDIMREKADWSDYVWIMYVLSLLIAVILLIVYFKLRKKVEKGVVEVAPVVISPHQKALSALQHLKDKSLWQTGNIKAYQSELTDIIRTYLEERYYINAPEMTTDEITIALEMTAFDIRYKTELKEILQVADLVKFAKAVPEENIHDVFMCKAVDFVIHTQMGVIDNKTQNSDSHD